MKRLSIILTLLLLCGTAFCQQLSVQKISEDLASSRVSFNFSFKVVGKGSRDVGGEALVQGQCFRVRAGSALVISDSKTRWTVDANSKEIYIERGGKLPSILTNPKQLAKSVSVSNSSADGISGVFSNPEDGLKYNFSISSFVSEPVQEEKSPFTFDATGLDKSWIVTDLR